MITEREVRAKNKDNRSGKMHKEERRNKSKEQRIISERSV